MPLWDHSRDARRRRVLQELVLHQPDRRATTSGYDADEAPLVVHAYGSASFLDDFPRLIDYIPRRWIGIGGLLVLAGATVAGLLAAYQTLGLAGNRFFPNGLQCFDLDGPANLAGVYSAVALMFAALFAYLVLSIRSYRVDDYAGTYRIWGWAAVVWLFMAVDESAGLHLAFRDVMVSITHSYILGDGSLWWIALYAVVLSAVGIRLLIDMRRDWVGAAIFLLAGVCYVAATVSQFPQVPQVAELGGAVRVMVEEGCELAGHTLIAAAMMVHARFILLQAEGFYPAPAILRRSVAGELEVEPRRGFFRRWFRRASRPSLPVRGPRLLRQSPEETLVVHPPHPRGRSKAVRRKTKRKTPPALSRASSANEGTNAFLAGFLAAADAQPVPPSRPAKRTRQTTTQNTTGASVPVSLPNRKLTKEEKKRLKQLYRQQQAQRRTA
ncbi:hypothetical protein JCM19992_26860 [Thermostilla marina]